MANWGEKLACEEADEANRMADVSGDLQITDTEEGLTVDFKARACHGELGRETHARGGRRGDPRGGYSRRLKRVLAVLFGG